MSYFKGTNSDDTLTGTVGADLIYGLDGDDIINGKEGRNTIFAGDGNDTITTGKGRDLVYGGDGDDLIRIVGNYGGTYIAAGHGRDVVTLDRAKEGTFLSLDYDFIKFGSQDPLESIEVIIRNDSMDVDKTDSSSNTIRDNIDGLSNLGTDGTVVLFGTNGDDQIDADRRSDGPMIIFHAKGNDTFNGSSDGWEQINISQSFGRDSDSNTSYEDNKIVITNNSSGQMSGRITQVEYDGPSDSNVTHTIRFTAMDMIQGSHGNDMAIGSSGNDKFRPGYGHDGFDGGRGRDTVYYDSEGIVHVLVDLQYGYAESLFANDAILDNFGGFYGRDRFIFEDQLQFDGLRSVENAVGSDGDDILRGSNKANVLEGGDGDDNLNGRKGNDTLVGGNGDDNLRGAGGRDNFQFDSSDGKDKIFRFENGKDKIVIGDGLDFSDVEISDHGRHTLVTFEDTSILVLNFNHLLLDVDDFVFI